MIDMYSYVTNRIFDLGDEAEEILDGTRDWDEGRLLEIVEELTSLQSRLGD